MLRFDHIIIGVQDLNQAIKDYTELGFNVVPGGEHASGTTHNALIVFRDGTYVELMARTGKPPKQDLINQDFAPFLHEEEGFAGYALYTDDLAASLAKLKEAGITTMSDPQPGQRITKEGMTIRWQMSYARIGGVTLILICDDTERAQRIPTTTRNITHPNGANGLKSLLHVTKNAEPLQQILAVFGQLDEDSYLLNDETRIILRPPDTDLLAEYHTKHGDSLWRVVLSGLGEMYKRLDATLLHGADFIIVGK